MGVFGRLFSGIRRVFRFGFYTGGIYTAFGYLYDEEIKYRLGDRPQCKQIERKLLLENMQSSETTNLNETAIQALLLLWDIFNFYSRTLSFREFQQDCKVFHKTVISTILRNYEQYGIFQQSARMQADLERGQISPDLFTKIIHIKELNLQFTNLFTKNILKIIDGQITMGTGAILGLTEQQRNKINLIHSYLQKGERMLFEDEEKYWQYKLIQSQSKRHKYGDTIFKIMFI